MNEQLKQYIDASRSLTTIDLHPDITKFDNYTKPDRDTFEVDDIVMYKKRQYRIRDLRKNEYFILSKYLNHPDDDARRIDVDYSNELSHCENIELIRHTSITIAYLCNKGILKSKATGKYYINSESSDIYYRSRYVYLREVNGVRSSEFNMDTLGDKFEIPTSEELNALEVKYKKYIADIEFRIGNLKKILNRVYPNNSCFDVKENIKANSGYRPNNNTTHQAIIHFPKIQITNKYDNSHEIVDLYIRFDFNKEGILTQTMLGARANITLAEFDTRYYHSHLSRCYNYEGWNQFCLGSTDLSQEISILQGQYKPILFETILYKLPDYLNWESLDGGPYVKIRNISIKNSSSNRKTIMLGDAEALYRVSDAPPLILHKEEHYNKFIVDRNNIEYQKHLTALFLHKYRDARANDLNNYITDKDIVNNIDISNSDNEPPKDKQIKRINDLNRGLTNTLLSFNGKSIVPKIIQLKDAVVKDTEDESIVRVLHTSSLNLIYDLVDKRLSNYLDFNTIYKKYEQSKQTDRIYKDDTGIVSSL